MPKKEKTETAEADIPRVVAFTDDGLVRLTCLAKVQDGDPQPGWAIAYALMRLLQVAETVRDEEAE